MAKATTHKDSFIPAQALKSARRLAYIGAASMLTFGTGPIPATRHMEG